ncbi:hypothetical protein COLO4_16063 [Corchorus olitorius]|uniref:Uncharacterized protein n=1 Tax=Corchorus olitorius TaxID=93759 RepID=A0A1R3JJW3_9ROSI|nr:hypothetical protein COLO4_16063 [Corchorus olitorius]
MDSKSSSKLTRIPIASEPTAWDVKELTRRKLQTDFRSGFIQETRARPPTGSLLPRRLEPTPPTSPLQLSRRSSVMSIAIGRVGYKLQPTTHNPNERTS